MIALVPRHGTKNPIFGVVAHGLLSDKDGRRVGLSSSVLLQTLGKLRSLQGTELSVVVVICLLGLL